MVAMCFSQEVLSICLTRDIEKGRLLMKNYNSKMMGVRIKAFRTKKGLSQEELAQIASVDVHHIASIENGRRNPSMPRFISIANALEVSADDILSDSLDYSKSNAGTEIHRILMDCNQDEAKMLLKTLRFMKALLSEYGI